MDVSFIIIHYHTPVFLDWLLESIDDSMEEGVNFEIIIVNNGGNIEASGRNVHGTHPIILNPGDNLGYARGINLGMGVAKGKQVFLMNSDLQLHKESIDKMLRALHSFDVVGPQFFLDDKCKFWLPPTERTDLVYELIKILSSTYSWAGLKLWKQWWTIVHKHMIAKQPVQSYRLSGALIGLNRKVWEIVGPMDENLRLYFEETDWLLRLKKKRLSSGFIPHSKVTHFYNQSPHLEPDSESWYGQSYAHFMKKHDSKFNRWVKRVTSLLATRNFSHSNGRYWERVKNQPGTLFDPIHINSDFLSSNSYMLLSNSPLFVPSAVSQLNKDSLKQEWSISASTWSNLKPGSYFFRIVDEMGRTILP